MTKFKLQLHSNFQITDIVEVFYIIKNDLDVNTVVGFAFCNSLNSHCDGQNPTLQK